MRIHWGERGVEPLPAATQTLLKQVISYGLRLHPEYKNVNCEINISFVTSAEIAELNKQYRSKDAPTDVLSFPNTSATPIPAAHKSSRSKPTLNLGDIVICTAVAESQAQEYGHSAERELAFLTAHGFLHLIGYDHNTPQEEATMIAMQKDILERVGIARTTSGS